MKYGTINLGEHCFYSSHGVLSEGKQPNDLLTKHFNVDRNKKKG